MEKDFELLRQTSNTEELIRILPTLNYLTQENFFQNSPYAKEVVDRVIEGDETILLGEIVKEPFFLSFLEAESLVLFRNHVNQIAKHHASLEFFQNVRDYYNQFISHFDLETGLFEEQKKVMLQLEKKKVLKNHLFYTKLDEMNIRKESSTFLKDYFQKKATILLSDMIVDALFEDNYYNVILNIREIFRFQKEENYLSDETMHFYQ